MRQFSKLILALLTGLAIGCQKGHFTSQNFAKDQSGIVREPVITPFTDFPGQETIPVYVDGEEEAPANDEGPKPHAPTPQPPPNENDQQTQEPDDFKWVPEGMKAEDFSPAAKMSPTIYYHPVIKDTADRCKDEERVDLLSIDDKVLKRVCKVDFARCSIQGTCTFVDGEERRSFNHHSQKGGVDRYFEMKPTGCVYGFGVTNICLDPFYSVAADLTVYKPGTVIFVPDVRGAMMPNGKPHTGFFVVRDRGGGVKGSGRFDFFTGSYSWNSDKNPFKALDLGEPRRQKKFYVVKSSPVATITLTNRNYPSVPK